MNVSIFHRQTSLHLKLFIKTHWKGRGLKPPLKITAAFLCTALGFCGTTFTESDASKRKPWTLNMQARPSSPPLAFIICGHAQARPSMGGEVHYGMRCWLMCLVWSRTPRCLDFSICPSGSLPIRRDYLTRVPAARCAGADTRSALLPWLMPPPQLDVIGISICRS